MVFVYPEEENAVQQLAQRVEEESGSFDGWERWTILMEASRGFPPIIGKPADRTYCLSV
jgi:hypothetical protein